MNRARLVLDIQATFCELASNGSLDSPNNVGKDEKHCSRSISLHSKVDI